MYQNKKTSVLNDYRPAADDELNKTHTIKEFFGKTDRHGTFTVYTDGSATGFNKTRDGKSFAGWGFSFRHQLKNGVVNEGSRFGNIFNGDPLEAELKAVIKALEFNREPSHFEVVSDCADVVKGFVNIHEKIAEFHAAQRTGMEGKSTEERIAFRSLRLWKNVWDEMQKNDNIVSMNIRWVRSHVLSEEQISEVNLEDFETDAEKRLVQDIVGNTKADKAANLGSIKAVRGALYYFINNPEENPSKYRSISTCSKNFSASTAATDEAIRFLSQQNENFLPKDILQKILPEGAIDKIESARKAISSGADANEILSGMIKSKKVLAFGESANNKQKQFLERMREKAPERDDDAAMGM